MSIAVCRYRTIQPYLCNLQLTLLVQSCKIYSKEKVINLWEWPQMFNYLTILFVLTHSITVSMILPMNLHKNTVQILLQVSTSIYVRYKYTLLAPLPFSKWSEVKDKPNRYTYAPTYLNTYLIWISVKKLYLSYSNAPYYSYYNYIYGRVLEYW